MRLRLLAILVVLVLAPLALLAWLGLRVVRSERAELARQFDRLLLRRLEDTDAHLQAVIRAHRETLQRELLTLAPNPSGLRDFRRRTPAITQVFLLDRTGRVRFPATEGASQGELDFLHRTESIWQDRLLLRARDAGDHRQTRTPRTEKASFSKGSKTRTMAADNWSRRLPSAGWHSYYYGPGLRLLFYVMRPDGLLAGAELSRSRLMAELVAQLPDSPTNADGRRDAIQLVDAMRKPVYAWGNWLPDNPPRVSRPLSEPLSALRLEYHVGSDTMTPESADGLTFSLLLSFGALALVLAGLATFVYRESRRDWRLAQQRVSFVNQVSHELKTPLTNVRLYAELLDQTLDEEADPVAHSHLGVIVAESRRLSRLIGNVLTFAREQRGALQIHRTMTSVDQHIEAVLQQFAPGLEQAGIKWSFHAGAPDPVLCDGDALEQVLGNLVSNVEKYAASGGVMEITSSVEDGQVVVRVRDQGPGVPAQARERIFAPFVRVSDRLADGVSGTGIGLSIARTLARQQGGELSLKPTPEGACFELVLPVRKAGATA